MEDTQILERARHLKSPYLYALEHVICEGCGARVTCDITVDGPLVETLPTCSCVERTLRMEIETRVAERPSWLPALNREQRRARKITLERIAAVRAAASPDGYTDAQIKELAAAWRTRFAHLADS